MTPPRSGPLVALLAALIGGMSGCELYRTYPLLTLEVDDLRDPELSGVAVLPDGRFVAVAEGEADALLVPSPDVPVQPGDPLALLPLQDGRAACRERRKGGVRINCAARHFRAEVRLSRQPVVWLDRGKGVGVPFDVEDLAPIGPERLLGVTKYTTVGRRTGFRRELIAKPRRRTERLFLLERRDGVWYEQDLPEITRLRDSLSDWGRASCNDDMLVEGLAVDTDRQRVFIGLSRCDGPAMKVLRYPLGAARLGLAAAIEVEADGVQHGGPSGAEAGPAEGITALSWRDGRLWALSAWDSYGYDNQAAFGGRLWEVKEGSLVLADVVSQFRDRPSGLAVLPARRVGSGATESEPDVDAIVVFDNDAEAGSAWRPNATVVESPTPAPRGGAWAELLGVEPLAGELPLGLVGFDLRWYARDHRLAQIAFAVARSPSGAPGGWTRALGGRWQMEVGGSMGMWSRALGLGRPMGHDKQAVAVADYAAAGLSFERFRVRVSVVPRDRERENPSVAELMEVARPQYAVDVPLPIPMGAGVLLQGFALNTSGRAPEGICVAGLELGAERGPLGRLRVQSTLVGGICNDFDTRGPTLRHGRTTRPDGGVEVTLDVAVVTGAPVATWSHASWDRSLPGPRAAGGGEASQEWSRSPTAVTRDALARSHLFCGTVGGAGTYVPLPREKPSFPQGWMDSAHVTEGTPGPASALRGFALALDPVGFDPGASRPKLTDDDALFRNNYISRYLVRVLPVAAGSFVEAGMSHGIHRGGLGRDNARPSALYARVDMTSFEGLSSPPVVGDLVASDRRTDPNLLPEDGWPRWASTFPAPTEPACAPPW